MMRPALVAALAVVLSPAPGWSHARLTTPAPRTPNTNLKSAPCGVPRAAGQATTTLAGGVAATITYAETVQHPGHYAIRLSRGGDANFTVLPLMAGGMADAIPNPDGMQLANSAEVMLPAEGCADCVIQLEQFMSETNTSYFSCANVTITAAPTENPGANPGGGGTAEDPKPLAPAGPLEGAGCAAGGTGLSGALICVGIGLLGRSRWRWDRH